MGRGFAVLFVAAGLASIAPSTSRADYEETEQRLKTAGIEPALRDHIHAAIDRGVAFLLSRQDPDGSWPRREEGTYEQTGIAALCTLALRHAGTAPAQAGVTKG